MKKILLIIFCCFLLTPILINARECPAPANAPPLYIVHCGQDASCPCEISDFFSMLARIFNFIVYSIATPLAVIMITIGAIMILISAGNPNLAGMGKKMLWISAIGLVLVFCSWLIINFILTALGYNGAWNVL